MASYTVRKGDTLWDLARKNKTTVNTIAKASGIKDPNKIYAGQRIVIPTASKPTPPRTTAPVSRPTTYKKPTATVSKPTTPKPTTPALSATDIQKIIASNNTSLQTGLNTSFNNSLKNYQDASTKQFTDSLKTYTDGYEDQFTDFTSQYEEKFGALQRLMEQQQAAYEKQYEDLMNRFRYVSSVGAPNSANANAIDAIQFQNGPGNSQGNANVTLPTTNVSMNDALFRYINKNLWGGGGF